MQTSNRVSAERSAFDQFTSVYPTYKRTQTLINCAKQSTLALTKRGKSTSTTQAVDCTLTLSCKRT